MLELNNIHHIALICSNYEISKRFYTEVLGFKIVSETFRKERDSYKLDLALNDTYCIELFSFPNPPQRLSQPEACGLRHIAFGVSDIIQTRNYLISKNIISETIRVDEFTGKNFFFINDPDGLPIEFYEK